VSPNRSSRIRLPEIPGGGSYPATESEPFPSIKKPIGNGRVPSRSTRARELPLVALPEDGYSR